VSESDENNNYVASPITVSAPSLPDLTITTGNPTVTPPTAAPGGTVSLSAWTIKNQGNADSGSFDNGFYLSTDSVITASDTYLDGNSNSNLAPGGQYNWGGPTLTIPSGTPLGNYYIGILVDRTNEVSESDEDNNYVASPITVSAPSFAVTKVQCKSYSASGTRTCPFTISYTFDITTNGAGTVSYHFERSDGYLSAATTLSFTGASTKTVSYSWTVGASGSYAVLCRTTAPNEMSDDSPPVAVTCSFAVTKVQAASYPASGTRTCPFTMNFGFDITTNGAGTVSYHFERSDGATSPTYTVSFTGTSTKRVSYSWTVVASGSYKVTCRTLAPNEMSSASPPITVTCS
jgi:subtilase family serine protease